MYHSAGLEYPMSARSASRPPATNTSSASRHTMKPEAPHVVSVSWQTTYKPAPPSRMPPPLNPPLNGSPSFPGSTTMFSAQPFLVSPKSQRHGATGAVSGGNDDALPRLMKGGTMLPLNFASQHPRHGSAGRRRSQQSLLSSTTADASVTSTAGITDTTMMTPNSNTNMPVQWRLQGHSNIKAGGMPGGGIAGPPMSTRPAGHGSRRNSQSGASVMWEGTSVSSMRGAALGSASAARQQQQRTLASAANTRGSANPSRHVASSASGKRGAKVLASLPVSTASSGPTTRGPSSTGFSSSATRIDGQPVVHDVAPITPSAEVSAGEVAIPSPTTAAAVAAGGRHPNPASAPPTTTLCPYPPPLPQTNADEQADVMALAATTNEDTTLYGARDLTEDEGGEDCSGATARTGVMGSSGEYGMSERVSPVAASSVAGATPSCTPPAPLTVFWNLTPFEEEEIREYLPEVYFTGNLPASAKIQASWSARNMTGGGGYDDENCHYHVKVGDHLAYRYEVTKELGRGTFGVVVSAIDHRAEEHDGRRRRVAIKLIKNKAAYTKQAGEEARLLETLVSDDPHDAANIVRLLGTFTFRSHYALVFELLQSDLYSYMQANNYQPFTQRFIFRFAESILVSLAHLAKHGIVHCDMKPENIVIDNTPEEKAEGHADKDKKDAPHGNAVLTAYALVPPIATTTTIPKAPAKTARPNDLVLDRLKLIDFGSSCTLDKRVFTYIQSRYYRAPEIVLGIPYTTAIDMWSFGCVMCELANGMPIFPASCEGELLDRMTEYLGLVPAYLVAQGKRSDKFFAPAQGHTNASAAVAPERPMLTGLSKKGRKRKAPASRSVYAFLAHVRETSGREEAHLFHDFVMRCLTFDPERRITPEEAMQHPWMVKWRAVTQAG